MAAGRASDAERAIREHVEIGYPSAIHTMAELYREAGLGLEGKTDYEAVETWLLRAAELGDYIAQLDLYQLYLNGASGIRRNPAAAVEWLSAAADQGHTPSVHLLGEHYERGQGVSRDYDRAIELYQQAATENHLAATLALANLYERGRGVKRDPDRVLTLLKKAKALGADSVDRRIEKLEKRR